MSETVVGCSVALLVLSIVFITCSDLRLPKRKVSRTLLEVFGLLYFAVVFSVLVLQTYRPAPAPVPKVEPLFYGPVDWSPKVNPRTGIGSIVV